MIKGLFFDFDNTLCDLAHVHYVALNNAIERIAGKEYIITEDEQINIYNGLSTKTKLKKLVSQKNLPSHYTDEISKLKQSLTLEAINNNIKENQTLKTDLSKLKSESYVIYCVSNALLETVELGLKNLGIFELFDGVIGNDDIKRQKPNPDIYLKAFIEAGIDPEECLVIEDSKHGREAAVKSKAYVCTVENPEETTYDHIKNSINKYNKTNYTVKWKDDKLTVLIPMSGAGSRFAEKGYKLPKPLIDVNGKPMIQVVAENLNIDAEFVFVVQKAHYENYNLGLLLPLIYPNCKIIQTNGLTEGAACTTLLAKEYINNDKHLLIANSDQFVEWDSCDFMYSMISRKVDGGILTFIDNSKNPKWSFAKLDGYGFVEQVAEKNPISEYATVGIYYFNKGSEYVRYAEQMISKNIRVNNEFYVCPVYNEFISDNKKIITYNCKKMLGLGTPEDLNFFLKSGN